MAGNKGIPIIEFFKSDKVLSAKLICLERESQLNTSGCLIRCKPRLSRKLLLVDKGSFPCLLVHQLSTDGVFLSGNEIPVCHFVNNLHLAFGSCFLTPGFSIRRVLCFVSYKGSMGGDFREEYGLVFIFKISMAADPDPVEIEILKDNRCFPCEEGRIDLEGQLH